MTDTPPLPDKRPAFEPAARLLTPTRFDPGMRRPLSTVAGAVLVMLRALAGLLWVASVAFEWPTWSRRLDAAVNGVDFDFDSEIVTGSIILIACVLSVVFLIDGLFALLILRGKNWPRVVVMWFSVVSISSAFAGWWAAGQEITINTTLLSLGLDILVLLALSSRSSAAYARRNERRPPGSVTATTD